MDVLLDPWRYLLAVCQSVCNWAVGQFGSRVLIQGDVITWLGECFAIGFDLLRPVTVHVGRPSPMLLYGQRATWQFLSVVPYSAKSSFDAQATPQDGHLWTRRCLRRLHRRLSLVNL